MDDEKNWNETELKEALDSWGKKDESAEDREDPGRDLFERNQEDSAEDEMQTDWDDMEVTLPEEEWDDLLEGESSGDWDDDTVAVPPEPDATEPSEPGAAEPPVSDATESPGGKGKRKNYILFFRLQLLHSRPFISASVFFIRDTISPIRRSMELTAPQIPWTNWKQRLSRKWAGMN
ncbi:MAG: hypothetical protein LUC83_08610 [Clostridiales bacterium]|nr:hypothetical protein [Clostridiales bacterium]